MGGMDQFNNLIFFNLFSNYKIIKADMQRKATEYSKENHSGGLQQQKSALKCYIKKNQTIFNQTTNKNVLSIK